MLEQSHLPGSYDTLIIHSVTFSLCFRLLLLDEQIQREMRNVPHTSKHDMHGKLKHRPFELEFITISTWSDDEFS